VQNALTDNVELHITDNLRPTLDVENLAPARDEIHELFLKHVMMQAPGYKKLMSWVGAPIMPTPAAVGNMITTAATQRNLNIVGVDIGGATTDVFSNFELPGEDTIGERVFNRTVSANFGMSYSISNVLAEAGIDDIMRWVPFEIDETDLRNRIKNKMIRPTTVPQTLEDLKIEQAIAREALRLSFIQHKELAVSLKGVRRALGFGDSLDQSASGQTVINMPRLDLLIASGGVLSHAPRRSQAMMMMIDAFAPQGITRVAVDSIFMMPHLGVLAQVNEQAATEVFERDCVVELGTCVSMLNTCKSGVKVYDYTLEIDGKKISGSIKDQELKLEPLGTGQSAKITVQPHRTVDMGAGRGKTVTGTVYGGNVGIVLDGRSRPLVVPQKNRKEIINQWVTALDAYPEATDRS
jgi:uncharacterized protein (TIGR01319 family)